MTKREASIVSAYTGILIGVFTDFAKYVTEIMGRPIFTHEYPDLADEIAIRVKDDFVNIKVEG